MNRVIEANFGHGVFVLNKDRFCKYLAVLI